MKGEVLYNPDPKLKEYRHWAEHTLGDSDGAIYVTANAWAKAVLELLDRVGSLETQLDEYESWVESISTSDLWDDEDTEELLLNAT